MAFLAGNFCKQILCRPNFIVGRPNGFKSTIGINKLKPYNKFNLYQNFQRHASTAVIYKNGFGMITKEVDLPVNKYSVETTPPDNAIHGTLWVTPRTPNVIVESFEYVQGTTEEHKLCSTIPELLQANRDQVVEVKVNNEWVRGRVGQVITSGTPAPGQKAGGLLMLDSEKGHTIVPLGDVVSMKLPFHPPEALDTDQSLVTRMDRAYKVNKIRINYRLTNNKMESAANISYVTRGLCWAPSYRFDIDPKSKTGKLSMKTVIINDGQDLNLEEVICAAGFPVMKYGGVTDPLVTRDTIENFLKNSGLDKDMTYTSSETGNMGTGIMPRADTGSDLYFYKFSNVSINKQDRISLPVFETVLPYTDAYYCKIIGDDETVPPAVLHAIKIHNNTKTPWSSGPIIITENEKFAAHSSLPFSPEEEDALVYMSESLDVKIGYRLLSKASDQEKTVFRKSYKAFTETGYIRARNLKDETVTVIASHDFNGEHLTAEGKPDVNTHHSTVNEVNNKNTITWTLTLAPGEVKELSHTYSYLQSV